jgi:hypothetical protein
MGQLHPGQSAEGEKLWLSTLIDTMEQVSRSELRSQPCDRSVAAAMFAQLSRPAAACPPPIRFQPEPLEF